jgi:hypothetical protein
MQMASLAGGKQGIYNRWTYFAGSRWTRIRQMQDERRKSPPRMKTAAEGSIRRALRDDAIRIVRREGGRARPGKQTQQHTGSNSFSLKNPTIRLVHC